jgi:hypothetical protein
VLGTNKLLIIPNNDKIYKSNKDSDKYKFKESIDEQLIMENFQPNYFCNTSSEDLESGSDDKLDIFDDLKNKRKIKNEGEKEGLILDFDMILVNLINIENKLNQDHDIKVVYEDEDKRFPKLIIRTGKVMNSL